MKLRSNKSDMAGISKKILIQGLRGIKCQKLGFLDMFLEIGHEKFLISCMMVEGNRAHLLSMVLYL